MRGKNTDKWKGRRGKCPCELWLPALRNKIGWEKRLSEDVKTASQLWRELTLFSKFKDIAASIICLQWSYAFFFFFFFWVLVWLLTHCRTQLPSLRIFSVLICKMGTLNIIMERLLAERFSLSGTLRGYTSRCLGLFLSSRSLIR